VWQEQSPQYVILCWHLVEHPTISRSTLPCPVSGALKVAEDEAVPITREERYERQEQAAS